MAAFGRPPKVRIHNNHCLGHNSHCTIASYRLAMELNNDINYRTQPLAIARRRCWNQYMAAFGRPPVSMHKTQLLLFDYDAGSTSAGLRPPTSISCTIHIEPCPTHNADCQIQKCMTPLKHRAHTLQDLPLYAVFATCHLSQTPRTAANLIFDVFVKMSDI